MEKKVLIFVLTYLLEYKLAIPLLKSPEVKGIVSNTLLDYFTTAVRIKEFLYSVYKFFIGSVAWNRAYYVQMFFFLSLLKPFYDLKGRIMGLNQDNLSKTSTNEKMAKLSNYSIIAY